MWPRMIIFLLFVGMLFAYYFWREWRSDACSRSIPPTRTTCGHWHVPPRQPWRPSLPAPYLEICASRKSPGVALTSCSCCSGGGIRPAVPTTVRHIARTPWLPNVEVVSVYPMAATAMRQVASWLCRFPRSTGLAAEGNATFVAHVLPHDYGMIEMFADVGTIT